jgi:glycerol-3-phosphate acyltransferase PlsX
MNRRPVIALDAMGGDHGAEVVIAAARAFLARSPDTDLVLVGQRDVIESILATTPMPEHDRRVRIHHASQTIGMDELPSKALRGKKDSSMRVAIDLVKTGEADACVSAGNTGALMATARFVLKMLPNVDRPAIISAMPSARGATHMLDLGANVDCTAEHLFQFAVMGSELVKAVEGVERPKVGLLNIGQEEIKGNDQVRHAHDLIAASNLNYVGYVEGDDIFMGDVDVVVADGFVGNVALKSSEGVAKLVAHMLRKHFRKSLWSRLAGLLALPTLKSFKEEADPRRYNGATLLGLRGIVVKSHGGADATAFENAIHIAEHEINARVIARIEHEVAAHLNTAPLRASA